MQNRILGTTMPVLEFALGPNDAVISEAGELSWMSASVQMTTHTQHAGGGGFFGAIKRVAGGGFAGRRELNVQSYSAAMCQARCCSRTSWEISLPSSFTT